ALLYQTQELRDYAHRQWDNNDLRSRAVVEAHTKIRNILSKVSTILEEARTTGRPLDEVQKVKQEIESIHQRMLDTLCRGAFLIMRRQPTDEQWQAFPEQPANGFPCLARRGDRP